MRRALTATLTGIVVIATMIGAPQGAGARPPDGGPGKSAAARATVRAGAASRSVLPLVDGSYDYLDAGFPDRDDPFDPGIPVPVWDDGRIAVGNGDSVSPLGARRSAGQCARDRRSPQPGDRRHGVERSLHDLPERRGGHPRQGARPAAARARSPAEDRRHRVAQPPRSRHGLRRQPRLVRAHDRPGRGCGGRVAPRHAPGHAPGRRR